MADLGTREAAGRHLIACACPGSPIVRGENQCPDDATQEDFLCDHCREMDCPTITSWEIREERELAQIRRIHRLILEG